MFRALLSFLLIGVLSGCASGSGGTNVAGFGAGNTALNNGRADRAPKGSYSRAPRGAFSNRSYRNSRLSPRSALKMVNSYRASKGFKPLRLNTKLSRAAKMHARDLARYDRISHHGSDGSDPSDRIRRSGYNPALAAENVGTGQVSLAEVFRGWKRSPGHNANLLLPDATHMGIALVKAPRTEYKTFWVMALGSPLRK